MVGIAGAIGDFDRDRAVLSDELRLFGDEVVDELADGDRFVASVSHPGEAAPQPASVDGTGESLWLWGNVYGFLEPGGAYRSKRDTAPSLSDAEYCARVYEREGPSFVAGLNGSFVGAILDDAGPLRLFTDRLGSRPMHYALVDEGVVFSTGIQPLCAFLGSRLSFDASYVTEYFAFERALGRKTPVAGVELAHPGAVTEIDPATQSVSVDVQWRPVHEPTDRSFDAVADRFADLFGSAVRERHDPGEETGVLLSGGSDSRLIMGAIPDEGVTGYHVNDWRNREARIAERIADVAGTPFTFVERDGDYYQRALAFSSRVSNYRSWFQHGHASGAAEVLRERCDSLMTGHYSDTLFKHNYLPYRGLLVPGTTVELPLYVERPVESTDDLVDLYLGTKFHNRKHLRAPPDYLRGPDLRSVLEANVRAVDGGIDHHGVSHRSAHDAAVFGECYPLTNTAGRLFFDVMLQTAPFRDPFLDVRLLDLVTEMPLAYRLRRNVINASIGRIRPELAGIPHPDTNVPLKYSFPIQYLALLGNWLVDRIGDSSPPEPHYTTGSWPDWEALLRRHDLVGPALDRHADLLDALDWLDVEQLRRDHERHVERGDRFDELSAAISFVSMPATRSVLTDRSGERTPVDRRESRPDRIP